MLLSIITLIAALIVGFKFTFSEVYLFPPVPKDKASVWQRIQMKIAALSDWDRYSLGVKVILRIILSLLIIITLVGSIYDIYTNIECQGILLKYIAVIGSTIVSLASIFIFCMVLTDPKEIISHDYLLLCNKQDYYGQTYKKREIASITVNGCIVGAWIALFILFLAIECHLFCSIALATFLTFMLGATISVAFFIIKTICKILIWLCKKLIINPIRHYIKWLIH